MLSSGAACPGLIEACSAPRILSCWPCSSGAACPGLIEAGCNLRLSWWLCAHPGLLAPASLKLWPVAAVRWRPAGSSGAACPGLIEATWTAAPGRLARHSSGAACPGLIEAGPSRSLAALIWSSSGAACPGLIEAVPGASGNTALAGSSGAACPGLIEAGQHGDWDCGDCGLIRGCLPRPH